MSDLRWRPVIVVEALLCTFAMYGCSNRITEIPTAEAPPRPPNTTPVADRSTARNGEKKQTPKREPVHPTDERREPTGRPVDEGNEGDGERSTARSNDTSQRRKSDRGTESGKHDAGEEGAVRDHPDMQPVLHGRKPARPKVSVSEAAASARRSLNSARSALKAGDMDQACRHALEAYETAGVYAATNSECGRVVRDAAKLLESAGRRNVIVDVPTRFE